MELIHKSQQVRMYACE